MTRDAPTTPLIMVKMLTAVYWFEEALQANLAARRQKPLSRTQSFLVANIAAGERRASNIADNLGVSRQAISQMLADLEARGVITVSVDPDDRRARIVTFSPAARDLRDAARAILVAVEEVLEDRIGPRKVTGLRRALEADWGPPPVRPEDLKPETASGRPRAGGRRPGRDA